MLARSTAWRHGRGPGLHEGDVDQQHAAVADQQVGRLDVAVGQAGVPQLADDAQAVVDHALVDLGLAELGGAVEELGDQQVLAVGGELDEAVGSRARQAGQVELVQGVVLLLDQPPDGVERLLVLQAAVEQLAAELVPPVRAQVAAGVQLAEQDRRRVAADLDPQRGGAGRPGQAERLHLLDLQAELVGEGAPDGLAPGPADVQVGAAAPPVADREDVVGGEPAEGEQRDGHPDGRPDQHVDEGVDAQVHAGEGEQGDQRGGDPLAELPPAALGDQAVEHGHADRGQVGDRPRRHRPAGPHPLDLHPEGPRPPHRRRQGDGHQAGRLDRDDRYDHVPVALVDDQDDQGRPGQHLDGPDGPEQPRDPSRQAGQAGGAEGGQPLHHPVVGDREGDPAAVAAGGEHQQGQRDQPDGGDHPADAGALQVARQRRRLPGRPPPATAPPAARRGDVAGGPDGVTRTTVHARKYPRPVDSCSVLLVARQSGQLGDRGAHRDLARVGAGWPEHPPAGVRDQPFQGVALGAAAVEQYRDASLPGLAGAGASGPPGPGWRSRRPARAGPAGPGRARPGRRAARSGAGRAGSRRTRWW